ncbi:MAG: L-aspartate oxidase [Crocinitomicaceae bacterium]
METDFLVIGSGMAGLTYIIKIAEKFPNKKIIVVTKGNEGDSNTNYAQGGVAIVQNETDSFEKHVQDTLIAGDGLCDEEVVRMVISEGPKCLREMVEWGVEFDTDKKGEYDLGKEGGHSENRVVHHKDFTGFEISRALTSRLKQLKNVTYLTNHFVVDLISDHHLKEKLPNEETTCYGAYVLNEKTNEIFTILSKLTMLASGGAGQVYGHTSNPKVATGDGLAMAYRIKAEIKEVEFIQFHPTTLYQVDASPAFLISEAVRGFGAKLLTKNGEKFMHNYDKREELASRDIVARAIDAELKKRGEDYVVLDCTHLDEEKFSAHFPKIKEQCKSLGIDVHKDYIPVVPASHYICGGIVVNKNGQTSIRNLFASGECSQTGLHGANRLASNSLLEAFVYADKCAEHSAKIIDTIEFKENIPQWNSEGTTHPKELVLISHNKRELQEIMRNYVGIVRSNLRLERALNRVNIIQQETEKLYKTSTISPQLCELRNMITVAYLIITHSQKRKENKGGFYNIDLQ